jgi:2-hydroxychromene-2-carboxylate isomerase
MVCLSEFQSVFSHLFSAYFEALPMSLLRRWFDPIRSSWFYQKPIRQEVLSTEQGLSIYLRLDDVYSYLAVQQLTQLDDILTDDLKPLKVIISNTSAEPPNGMTVEEWRNYCLEDAKILANQHRFSYDDEKPEQPSPEALKQAEIILRNTPLTGQNFLYLLEDVFHMLWQQQYGKLRTLFVMASQHQKPQNFPERIFSHTPILESYFEFGGRKYHAVDDLLRLTRRLKQQKLLTGNPIFLINHIEWREHLMSDAEELAEIQAMHPELDLYIALEDPISWLLLAYIKEELANYYNIQLNLYPLSYHGRDAFDWSLATRLSKRSEVKFTPFCRPTAESTLNMAQLYYSVPEEQRVDVMYDILQAVWTKGRDLSFKPHLQQMQQDLAIENLTEIDVEALLKVNDQQCAEKHQPDFPVLELRIEGKRYVFNSLYRVWMIESIFSNVLEHKYKTENALERAQHMSEAQDVEKTNDQKREV